MKYTGKQTSREAIHLSSLCHAHTPIATLANVSTAIRHHLSSYSLLSREEGLSGGSSRLAVGDEPRDGIQSGMRVCVFGFVPCALYFPPVVLSGLIFNVPHPSVCHSVAALLVCVF